jgi:hypothetical protein
MSTDIAGMIRHCDQCQFLRASQAAEPLQNQAQTVEPMQSVSMDLYEVKGRHFCLRPTAKLSAEGLESTLFFATTFF